VQELLAGLDQFQGPATDELGIADKYDRVARQQLHQELHPVDQGR
jgi:hypothetical protein